MSDKKHYVLAEHFEDECITLWTPIKEDDLKKIEEIVGHNFIESMGQDNPVSIHEISFSSPTMSPMNNVCSFGKLGTAATSASTAMLESRSYSSPIQAPIIKPRLLTASGFSKY